MRANDFTPPANQRRPYRTPQLVDYGAVANLTRGGSGTAQEHFNMGGNCTGGGAMDTPTCIP